MGFDFWKGACEEHQIHPDLTCDAPSKSNTVFFEEIDSNRYVPRSVMVDLEPGVVNSVMASDFGKVFNPETIVFGQNGAGNCWASGFYSEGCEIIDEVMEKVRKEAEKCESMEGFIMTHSLGGGTGSGLGSLLLKEVNSEFSDKMIAAYSVFPSTSVSDVVVEPYNSSLAMNYLIEESNFNVVLDNEALYGVLEKRLKQKHPSFSLLNQLIEKNLLETTASMRFGGMQNAGLRKMATNLCPFPRLHFLTTSVTPLFS